MSRRHLPLLVVLITLALAAIIWPLLPRPVDADAGRLQHAIRGAVRQQVPPDHHVDAVGEPDDGEMIEQIGDGEWAVRARVDLRDALGRPLSGVATMTLSRSQSVEKDVPIERFRVSDFTLNAQPVE